MTTKLVNKKCVPCEGGMPSLNINKVKELQSQISGAWKVEANRWIERKFKFEDFPQAMEFVNKVAEIAEVQGHHPDIEINYNKVRITLTTHAIDGLSENDFIIASQIERL